MWGFWGQLLHSLIQTDQSFIVFQIVRCSSECWYIDGAGAYRAGLVLYLLFSNKMWIHIICTEEDMFRRQIISSEIEIPDSRWLKTMSQWVIPNESMVSKKLKLAWVISVHLGLIWSNKKMMMSLKKGDKSSKGLFIQSTSTGLQCILVQKMVDLNIWLCYCSTKQQGQSHFWTLQGLLGNWPRVLLKLYHMEEKNTFNNS